MGAAAMTTSHPSLGLTDDAIILGTDIESDLDVITRADIQAVIYVPPTLPAWFAELSASVEASWFQIPRTQLPSATRGDIETWLDINLPHSAVAEAVVELLKADILGLVDRLISFGLSSRFMLRIFTEAPTTECGFHVDTVPPGVPVHGLLRVYNGAGTLYTDARDIIDADAFFQYLGRRERLARERNVARADADIAGLCRIEQAIIDLDRARPFMRTDSVPRVAPAGSIVAFKHADIGLLWSNTPLNAWVHCSPMEGRPRLVVNVSPAERAHRPARRSEGRTAH
jgi:hypothetical protein